MSPPRRIRSLLALLALAGVCACGGGGVTSTLLPPGWQQRLPRTRQSEALANLKAMYTAEKAYFAEHDRYTTDVALVGFSPERNNWYRYVLTARPRSLEDRSGSEAVHHSTDEGVSEDTFLHPELSVSFDRGPCSGSPPWGVSDDGATFTGAAYGDIDGDGTLDLWTISTVGRWLGGSGCDSVRFVPSGEPVNEIDDLDH